LELQAVQDNIQQYHPWFDDSFRDLAVLRQLSLAFPEEGDVMTAKTIEIRDDNTVSFSGTARDYAAVLAMQANLRKADGVTSLKLDQIRGKNPMQFTFDFQYESGGAQ
jgi:Tfp pilus assembly protein PilN